MPSDGEASDKPDESSRSLYVNLPADDGVVATEAEAEDPTSALERAATQNIEYQSVIEKGTHIEDVAADCWGSMVFIIMNDFPDLIGGHTRTEQKTRMFFAFVMSAINLLIQITLLVFIYNMLMMPSFRSAQNLYRDFHEKSFEGGKFSKEKFSALDFDTQDAICGLALSMEMITKILVFLWVSTNIGELLNTWKFLTLVVNLPRLPKGLDSRLMVRDVAGTTTEEFWVICADIKTKMALLCIVYVPKLIIATILTLMGSLWLLASESFGDLILNSLALAFVTSVDELLAQVFFPTIFMQNLIDLGYSIEPPSELQDPEKASTYRTKCYIAGFCTLITSCVIVQLLYKFQPVLPNFEQDVAASCQDYLAGLVPWCFPGQTDCFPTA